MGATLACSLVHTVLHLVSDGGAATLSAWAAVGAVVVALPAALAAVSALRWARRSAKAAEASAASSAQSAEAARRAANAAEVQAESTKELQRMEEENALHRDAPQFVVSLGRIGTKNDIDTIRLESRGPLVYDVAVTIERAAGNRMFVRSWLHLGSDPWNISRFRIGDVQEQEISEPEKGGRIIVQCVCADERGRSWTVHLPLDGRTSPNVRWV
jgi:hypothetical protein